MAAVDLDARLSVGAMGSSLVRVLLFADAGTAVTFFFTRYTDLFFAEAMFSAGRRKFGFDRERRVLTFPSGLLLFWEFDLNLFTPLISGSLDLLRLRLVVGVLVGSRKDAEGDGNTGFKVQVDDLPGARLFFSSTEGKRRSVLLLLS